MNFSKIPTQPLGQIFASVPAESAPSNAWPLGTGLQLPSEDPNSWRDFVAPPTTGVTTVGQKYTKRTAKNAAPFFFHKSVEDIFWNSFLNIFLKICSSF